MNTNTCANPPYEPVMKRTEKRNGATHIKKQTGADRPALSKQIGAERTASRKQKKNLSNSRNPGWLSESLDLSRDRKPPKRKKGKGGSKLGNPRLYAYNQKQSRLELQVGEESFLSGFSMFVKESSFKTFDTQAWSVIESLLLFMYDLTRARSIIDFFVASIHLFKHYTKENLLTESHMAQVKKLVDVNCLQDCREGIDDFGRLLTDWKRVTKSPLLEKLSKVLIYCSTVGLYKGAIPVDMSDKVGKIYKTFKKNSAVFHTDFLYYILDLLHFVCDKAYGLYFEGKDPKTLFSSNLAYDDWYDKCEEILLQAEIMGGTEFHYDVHSFLSTIEELIRVGEEVHKFACDIDRSVRNLVKVKIGQLKQVKTKILASEAAQSMRPEPFGLVIEGDSGIGKSKVIQCIAAYYAALFGKTMDGMYTKNATTKFWDGFKTYMWCLLLDDVGMWSSDIPLIDETILDIIRILNTMPFMPDMAALEDKGKTPFRGELVFVSTNVPDLKLNEYFTYPFAAARRLPFHIRVKPRETEKGTFMIKENNLKMGEIPDSWTFDILEPVPIAFGQKRHDGSTMRQAKLKLLHSDLSMSDLLLFVKEKATIHKNRQDKMIEHNNSLLKLDLCDNCKLPHNFCPCNEPQVGTVAQSIFEFFLSYVITRVFDTCLIYWASNRMLRWYTHFFGRYIKSRLRNLRNEVIINARDKYAVLKSSPYVPIFAAVLATLMVLYRVFCGTKEQGGVLSNWGTTYDDLNEPESTWRKEPMPIDTFDSTPQCLSLKGSEMEKVKSVVRHNLLYLRYYHENKWFYCRMFNIIGQKCIVPSHCIPIVDNLPCEILRGTKRANVNTKFSFTLCKDDIVRIEERDLCVVTIHGMNLGKDMRPLFGKSRAQSKAPAFYLGIDSSGEVEVEYVSISKPSTNVFGKYTLPVWRSRGLSTKAGDCGKILCRLDDMGFRILGIHRSLDKSLFYYDEPCAVMITQEYLETLSVELDDLSTNLPQLGKCLNEEVTLRDLSTKSILRSVDTGCMRIFGNVKSINRPRSKVKQTLLCSDMLDMGFELRYDKPDMQSTRPWKRTLAKLSQADLKADWSILQRLRCEIVTRWFKETPERSKQELKILDMHTVINGKPGVRYIDAMPRKTSAGFPWCTPKNNFMLPVDEDFPYGDQVVDDAILEKVSWRLEQYQQGKITYPVFRGSLKDEATSLKKCAIGKTRVFMGAPIDFTMVVRSVLLSFVRVTQCNKFVFESAPGLEAQSSEWDDLAKYLTTYGEERMIFGDFSGFDATMRADFMLTAFSMIEDFHRLCGATEEHCLMIRGIGHDITFPLVEYNGDLIQLFGKNPSGQPLTVTINGLVNSLYMRYCFVLLRPKIEFEKTFERNVKLITYGDDNGMGVSESVPWFNHSSVSEVMKTIGVNYTMADKESISRPYITLCDADFLKRKWRFESDLGKRVCPLNVDSIIKSLMIGLKSVNICEQEHAASIITSANDEFFWHGKEVFHKWHERFQFLIDKHQLEDYMPCELKGWDDLCEAYKERSRKFQQQ